MKPDILVEAPARKVLVSSYYCLVRILSTGAGNFTALCVVTFDALLNCICNWTERAQGSGVGLDFLLVF